MLTAKEFQTEAAIQKHGRTAYLVDDIVMGASWSEAFLDLEVARSYALEISGIEPEDAICVWELDESLHEYEWLLSIFIDGEEWIRKNAVS